MKQVPVSQDLFSNNIQREREVKWNDVDLKALSQNGQNESE